MTPSVYSYAKKKGCNVSNTLPYFTNDSHKRILEKSEILTAWLRENFGSVGYGLNIQHSLRDSFIFWIRGAVHYCLRIIEIALNAADKHEAVTLGASLSGRKAVSNIYIQPEERYLGYLVNMTAKEKGLGYEDISRGTWGNFFDFSRLENYLLTLIKVILKYGEFGLWEKKVFAERVFSGKGSLLFTTPYNMDSLVDALRGRRVEGHLRFLGAPVTSFYDIPYFIIRLLGGVYAEGIWKKKKQFKDLVNKISEEKELFSYRNVAFAEVIARKLEENIAPFISGQMLWAARVGRLIDRLRPLALISNGGRLDDILLADLCREKNIPGILISHGSHVRPKNKYEKIEWGEHGRSFLRAAFSFLALQSPLAEGYLEVFPSEATVIKTSPVVWGKPVEPEKAGLLFERMVSKKYDFAKTKIILHAGTPKPVNNLRLHVYETADEYIRGICELAEAVGRIPDTILIIKFRPGKEIAIDDLRYLVPFSDKVILSVNESFAEVLGMSDLLVSFSSTTIEEALQNRIPVLLYGGEGRYQHISACEAKQGSSVEPKAVYHVNEARDLEYALRLILSLNIDRDKNHSLFAPYIYAQDERVPLADWLARVFSTSAVDKRGLPRNRGDGKYPSPHLAITERVTYK